MTDESATCRNCGAPLKPGARYCEACGQAVDIVTTPASYLENTPPPPPESFTPPPAEMPQGSSFTPPPAPGRKSKFPVWLIVVLGLVVLCICGVLVAGIAFFTLQAGTRTVSTNLETAIEPYQDFNFNDTVAPTFEPTFDFSAQPTFEAPGTDMLATDLPGMTVSPTDEPLSGSSTVPDVPVAPAHSGQYSGDNQIFDDFSNQDLGWDVYSDETTNLGYEDEQYFIQIMDSQWIVWSYIPVDFYPTAIEFDAQIPQPYTGNGTVGVMCLVQDEDNYYYVDIDVENSAYQIGQSTADQYTYLTNDEWETSDDFAADPSASNHYAVTCDTNQISLFINGKFEDQVFLTGPVSDGSMAIYGFSWENMDENGLKIYFDNVSAWQQ